MIHNIYTIYDEKAAAYLVPFFLPRDGMAKRTFSDCVNSKDHQFGAHPHDYTLFRLGQWDDGSATIELDTHSVSLGNGLEFLKPSVPEDQMELLDGGIRHEITPQKIGDEPPIQRSPESGNTT